MLKMKRLERFRLEVDLNLLFNGLQATFTPVEKLIMEEKTVILHKVRNIYEAVTTTLHLDIIRNY